MFYELNDYTIMPLELSELSLLAYDPLTLEESIDYIYKYNNIEGEIKTILKSQIKDVLHNKNKFIWYTSWIIIKNYEIVGLLYFNNYSPRKKNIAATISIIDLYKDTCDEVIALLFKFVIENSNFKSLSIESNISDSCFLNNEFYILDRNLFSTIWAKKTG